MQGTKHAAGVLCVAAYACAMLGGPSARAGTIDPGLRQVLSSTPDDEVVSALVFLKDRVDLEALDAQLRADRVNRSARHETVVRALQDRAAVTQTALRAHLAALRQAGRIESFKSFWLVNAFRVDAPPAELRQLAQHPDVETIYLNYPIEPITPVHVAESALPSRGPEPGLVAINAPDVWDLGITGAGVLVATVDSGVDGNHPALADRWAGVADPRYADHPEWAWHDALFNTAFPQDLYGHGTHTMGTVCGGSPGDQVGVAPGALWISACNLAASDGQFVDNSICCLQWIVDPDGDPSTFWDVPVVCSNSWGLPQSDQTDRCDQLSWSFIDACEAAGVVMVFSAGNDGELGPGIPANRASDAYNTCAIGAVDANTPGWPIAFFSARGPTYCTPAGDPAIKPEVVAPGVHVRSSIPGGEYLYADGTSMASPHVNGVVALMMEACPYLTVDEVKQILYDTAVDLGDPGEDNDYGWGMIDALAAVNMALDVCSPRPPYAWDDSYATEVNTSLTVGFRTTDDGLPDPPGMLSHAITTLPVNGVLRDPGAGVITDVPYVLVNYGDQVIYDPDVYYQGPDSFGFLANDGGSPPDGGDSDVAIIALTVGLPSLILFEPLDEDPGWDRECEWAFGQPIGQGGADWGWPDPNSGATGANVFGVNLEGDYDFHPSGPCCLTTSPLDFTGVTDVTLRFQRWLNIDAMIQAEAWIEVTNDGVTWHEFWCNGMWQYTDNQWRAWEYDISDIADNQPAVRVRWGYQTHPMVSRMSGWNIDDIEFWGMLPAQWIPGDLDGDGDVDLADLAQLLGHYGMTEGATYEDGDLDGDGDVDLADLAALLEAYGTTCE
jgi:subtilisin family serine protease